MISRDFEIDISPQDADSPFAHADELCPDEKAAPAATGSLAPPAHQDKETLFRDLVKQYGRRLHYFVLRKVGNETDAADIAQQAFVEAAMNFSNFRGESGVATWIFGIAVNLTRNHLNRSPQRRYVFESSDALEGHAAPDSDPCEALARRQLVGIVASSLETLPQRMSEALMLVSIDGLSYQEAAVQLGIPVGTVRSRVCRARATIRDHVRAAGGETLTD
jgi:RNA polymerase sigma factor (sigma-70 family)